MATYMPEVLMGIILHGSLGSEEMLQDGPQTFQKKWKVCGENLYARHSIEYTFKRASQYFSSFFNLEPRSMSSMERVFRMVRNA